MFNEKLVAVANQLVEGCRNGTEQQGLDRLYHPDAVSVEAAAMSPESGRETTGLAGIKGKHEWWNNAHEVHKITTEGPFLHGDDKFSVIFGMDVTNRETNERMQMQEVAIYTVNGGKIVREEFFYPMPG